MYVDFFIILITYGIIFVGELGDKTQLIVFNLALDFNKFYKVGIGVSIGFAFIVTIGVFFGIIITELIPLYIISIVSGIVFIIIGLLEMRPLKKLYLERKKQKEVMNENIANNNEDNESEEDITSRFTRLKKSPYLAGFGFIFIMELGDKTQILTISLASFYGLPVEVWIGAFLALITVAWMGILIGAAVAKKLPKFYLKIVSVSIFIVVGIIVIINSI